MHEVFAVSEHVRQIQEVEHVFFALVTGTERAILWDAGYGVGENRAFVEQLLGGIPYILVNSHGHEDHVQGDWEFPAAYLHPADRERYEHAAGRTARISTFFQFGRPNGMTREEKDAYIAPPKTRLLPLSGDERWDLGGVHVRLVCLPGHTRGEVGLLIEEDRLLLSGDAFSEDAYLFCEGHDTMAAFVHTLDTALSLPFDRYLGSHRSTPLPQSFLADVRENALRQEVVPGSGEVLLGIPTVTIRYKDSRIRIPADPSERT